MADVARRPRGGTDHGAAVEVSANGGGPGGVSRRRFLGYLIAAPTVVAGAQCLTEPAEAAIPTIQLVDADDLSDLLTESTMPTAGLITVVVNSDGTVHSRFRAPRSARESRPRWR